MHKQTAPGTAEIAEFIARNLPFVEQVALMGLEMIGLARANMPELWIDPVDYRRELVEAVTLLDRRRHPHHDLQPSALPPHRRLWPLAVRSISDWKTTISMPAGLCGARRLRRGLHHQQSAGPRAPATPH